MDERAAERARIKAERDEKRRKAEEEKLVSVPLPCFFSIRENFLYKSVQV